MTLKAILFDAGDILYYRPRRGEALAAFVLATVIQRERVRGTPWMGAEATTGSDEWPVSASQGRNRRCNYLASRRQLPCRTGGA